MISRIVLRPLIASVATLALNSGLQVRRFTSVRASLWDGSPPHWLTMRAVQKNLLNSFQDTNSSQLREKTLTPSEFHGRRLHLVTETEHLASH
jgi:hypothetical protein